MKWDRVSVSKTLARELLLPGRLALYASAENEAIVERLKEVNNSSCQLQCFD